MSWNSFTFGLLAQERITQYLKEAADDRRVAIAVARRTTARARPALVVPMALGGLVVRALMPTRRQRGNRCDTLGRDSC